MNRSQVFQIPAIAMAVLLFLATGSNCCVGQLEDEMRDLLSELVEELDPDLRIKFQSAIDRNCNSIILTPDQFRRFREHPLNPFEGMTGIDPSSLQGNIELKFEIPSLRDRVPLKYERQDTAFLSSVETPANSVSPSIVSIYNGNKMLCYGTVVASPTRILAKASELVDVKNPVVASSTGNRFPARVISKDDANDLAILELVSPTVPAAGEFVAVQWSDRQPQPGEFVVTPGQNGSAVAFGTYSNPPRAQQSQGQGFLGVQPQNGEQGVSLIEVTPGGAADLAGLRAGDIIRSIDGMPVADVSQLVAEIGRRRAGDEILLDILRDQTPRALKAVLAGRDVSAERAGKFRMMNRLGAIPSRRADGFEWVFQHDTPLFPEQCGGPVLDLEGNAIGINIAREGRVSSLAIPASHLKTILPGLLRETVAANPDR